MNCDRCDLPLEERLSSRVQPFRGYYYLIENVPTLVCPRCGEEYVTPQTHDALLRFLQQEPEPLRSEKLDVLDMKRAV